MDSIPADRRLWNRISSAYQREHDRRRRRRDQLTCGDWVRVLRGAGLVIDDLIEPRPEPGRPNGCNETDPPHWAHRWPAELLWVTRTP
ncbi:hypothetical protein C9F11_42465 [Streptomyces sp. YIM 121038]|uniref:hypothetical protein n=1 Tax=Streptomyces sp. YIM 121038 TaxID=2136401 RepID=UPI0011653E9D|nr:hypothetical protein [Streptomyces sp. YIM 121038]QCX73746.1 hypothetical protein C9F11_00215 [Streptomyces sp. YIM 121038]QCX82073.1 hypothetical protein C9F11_42465 [Streptomyces sp. YIM 121038]